MIVCFSHLRWDFVWQRPQHLMSRFAHHMPVLFVEEPQFVLAQDEVDFRVHLREGVTIFCPLLPRSDFNSSAFNMQSNPIIQRLVSPVCTRLRSSQECSKPSILWYYTPMALGAEPLGFAPAIAVFDAMDELSAFRGSPAAMLDYESALLAKADIVFAGGPSLYEARRDRHHAVHCFPSGVESEHFAAALNGVSRPQELGSRSGPILGYCGVIDERVDLDLIAALADHRSDWTIAMVGPVTKIRLEDLPQRPNIIWFGQQDYGTLPGFLACFDVALLPFARNDATRFISPTKTLEYLAAGRPVVSTPIADVVTLYQQVVAIGESEAGFIQLVEEALAEAPMSARDRRLKAATTVADYHWDSIAARMWSLMEAEWQQATNDQLSFA